jgi:hypothetical protein
MFWALKQGSHSYQWSSKIAVQFVLELATARYKSKETKMSDLGEDKMSNVM